MLKWERSEASVAAALKSGSTLAGESLADLDGRGFRGDERRLVAGVFGELSSLFSETGSALRFKAAFPCDFVESAETTEMFVSSLTLRAFSRVWLLVEEDGVELVADWYAELVLGGLGLSRPMAAHVICSISRGHLPPN